MEILFDTLVDPFEDIHIYPILNIPRLASPSVENESLNRDLLLLSFRYLTQSLLKPGSCISQNIRIKTETLELESFTGSEQSLRQGFFVSFDREMLELRHGGDYKGEVVRWLNVVHCESSNLWGEEVEELGEG